MLDTCQASVMEVPVSDIFLEWAMQRKYQKGPPMSDKINI